MVFQVGLGMLCETGDAHSRAQRIEREGKRKALHTMQPREQSHLKIVHEEIVCRITNWVSHPSLVGNPDCVNQYRSGLS